MRYVKDTFIGCVVAGALVLCFYLGLVVIGLVDTSPYVDISECVIVGEANQHAIGEIFTLSLDNKNSVKIQKSACFNMNNASIGDVFTVVVVYDEHDVLQSITRVAD